MKFPVLFFVIMLCIVESYSETYPTYNVDRPYTLRYLDYSPLLYRYHDITVGDAPQTFYYPQINPNFRNYMKSLENINPVLSFYQRTKENSSPEYPLLYWSSLDNSSMIAVSSVLAFDVRGGSRLGDTIQGYEGGLFVRGYKDSIEFWLDARMFSEGHSATSPKSWDREFLENQGNKNIDGEVEYSSYTRYRGHFTLRMGWANLDFARDVAHWGPGYYNNLTLNQAAVPYNQVTLSTKIGPLSVISLYGDLDAGTNSMGKTHSRNLYGHRYELELGNLMLGISEITVIYDINTPWLFVPIVPLFAEKGNFSEDNNNGAISFDFSYRFPIGFRIYSEFFLDDMESPTSLVRNDNIEAKWAWMAGVAYAGDFGTWKIGSIAEYARMEPYVLSHFDENTAQIAHLGYPIGLPAGPNSQTIDWLVYAKHSKHFQMQLKQEWSWKGTDYGSEINDTTPREGHHSTPKSFLKGAKMRYSLTPAISYMGSSYAISTEYRFFNGTEFCSRIMFLW